MPKPKPCTLTRVTRSDDPDLYARLRAVINEAHPHLSHVEIALFFKDRMKPSKKTGRVVLGRAKAYGDEVREYTDDAGSITLNAVAWQAFTEAQQDALLDHYLSSFGVAELEDERGRVVLEKHTPDAVGYSAVIRRRGLYLSDLREAAKAMLESRDAPLLASLADPARDDDASEYPRAAEVG
jgi:hypothetical protein